MKDLNIKLQFTPGDKVAIENLGRLVTGTVVRRDGSGTSCVEVVRDSDGLSSFHSDAELREFVFQPSDRVRTDSKNHPLRGTVVRRDAAGSYPVTVRFDDVTAGEGVWKDTQLVLIERPAKTPVPASASTQVFPAEHKNNADKYVRTIHDKYTGEPAAVDVYEVILAWEVTDPGCQQALKKILQPGDRNRGTAVEDIEGAIVALQRSLTFAQRRVKEEAYYKEQSRATHTPCGVWPASTMTDYVNQHDPQEK